MQGGAEWVRAICLAAALCVVVLLSDCLLTAVSRRLRLTRLQIEAQVGGGSVPSRLHAHFLRLTHGVALFVGSVALAGGLGDLVGAACMGSLSVADEVPSLERYLLVRRGLVGHFKLRLTRLLVVAARGQRRLASVYFLHA